MFNIKTILNFIFLLPLIGSCLLIIVNPSKKLLLKSIALFVSSITFLLSLCLWIFFDDIDSNFQFLNEFHWFGIFNLKLLLGIDGISLFFIILTTLLIFLCILLSWDNVFYRLKEYLIAFLIMEFFLIGVFCILDVLLFYVFFESVLIPMVIIIGFWGSRERKIRASYFFFFYTLTGSVLMLLAVIYLYYQTGTTDYSILLTVFLTEKEQYILWLAFFASFATKVPMLPVHVWLPEAHVEAPTSGSVILAGILLKLGSYGLLRFSLPLFPKACVFFAPFIYTLAIIGVIYASFTAIRQTDFKRIIAYTSVAHMNLVVVGIFSFNNIGIEGAVLQSISHGFVASSLFLIIGVVYDRHHTRMVKYFSGLVHVMPIYVFIFLFFTMANIGLPGTSSFIGEFLILLGAFKINTTVAFLSATGMVLGGCYSLWLFNRISYGNLKTQYLKGFSDLSLREFVIFSPLVLSTLFVGIYPEIILNSLHISINTLLEHVCYR